MTKRIEKENFIKAKVRTNKSGNISSMSIHVSQVTFNDRGWANIGVLPLNKGGYALYNIDAELTKTEEKLVEAIDPEIQEKEAEATLSTEELIAKYETTK
tara:strand:- start:1039 stop:1338 length:300 start_codon:yes stop_codon:yes gene_type:complete